MAIRQVKKRRIAATLLKPYAIIEMHVDLLFEFGLKQPC